MRENDNGSKLLFFLAGTVIGSVVALLFAPKSGEETREYLEDTARKGKKYLSRKGRELKDQATFFVDKGKEAIRRGEQVISAAAHNAKRILEYEK